MLQRMAKRIRLPSALRALARKLTITINRFTGKETEKRQPARACFHFSGDWAKRGGPHGPSLPVLSPGLTIVTWLILPVVICLSQRLSHACLSINNFIL